MVQETVAKVNDTQGQNQEKEKVKLKMVHHFIEKSPLRGNTENHKKEERSLF